MCIDVPVDHSGAAQLAGAIIADADLGGDLFEVRNRFYNLARAYLELAEDEEADQRLRDERLAQRRSLNNSPDAETT